ncbi:unnamed protein product [Bemisia tabaci]|uniref:Uncharacterized protein n=1 Tax=Bemisia tabaci TaxID=7038 RepID=A0A9P0A2J3_BEMTA|nr:unnamed protein product [Bemisia tabaci]
MTIRDLDLEEGSILSDDIIKHVDGLYTNKVWNCENYLIFYLQRAEYQSPNCSPEAQRDGFEGVNAHSKLLFVFKFMWRMFKGQRTLICMNTTCQKYDPFNEKIIQYAGMDDEKFFDFSWHSMNGKKMIAAIHSLAYYAIDTNFNTVVDNSLWFVHAISVATSWRNGSVYYVLAHGDDVVDAQENEILLTGLKYGVDVLAADINIKVFRNFEYYDASTYLDSCQLVFITPRAEFIPQYIAVFNCFSSTTWMYVLLTLIVFTLIHIMFFKVERNEFPPLYREEELPSPQSLSTLLTIVRFFQERDP